MTDPIPFMCRRARLIKGQTQHQFAKHLGVDQGTISRWERGKQHPTPALLSEIRQIVIQAEPAHNRAYIEHSPTIKLVVDRSDFSRVVVASKGLLKALGTTNKELIRHPEHTMWSSDGQKVSQLVHADPMWDLGGIAFVETTHKATFGWVHTILTPIAETAYALWEGVLATEANLEFLVELIPFEMLGDDEVA